MLSHEVKIQRFVEDVARRIDHDDSRGLHHVAYNRLDVILHKCGYKRRSKKNVVLIQTALEQAGIFAQPQITDRDLEHRQKIYFSRTRPTAAQKRRRAGMLFPSEKGLERFIEGNLRRINGLRGLQIVKSQFELGDGARIDLLCRDRKTRDYVVIELKRADADHRVVGQIVSYLDQVRKGLADPEGVGVRGIIITGQPNAALAAALERIDYDISWLIYDVNISMKQAGE